MERKAYCQLSHSSNAREICSIFLPEPRKWRGTPVLNSNSIGSVKRERYISNLCSYVLPCIDSMTADWHNTYKNTYFTIISEVNQKEKDTYHMVSFICDYTVKFIYETETDSDIEKKLSGGG